MSSLFEMFRNLLRRPQRTVDIQPPDQEGPTDFENPPVRNVPDDPEIPVEFAEEEPITPNHSDGDESSSNQDSSVKGYPTSQDHIWAHLSRIDILVQAYAMRWMYTIGDNKPSHMWGMLHVSEKEMKTYLGSNFIEPDSVPDDLYQRFDHYKEQAEDLERTIRERVKITGEDTELRFETFLHRLNLYRPEHHLERDVLLICLLAELDERYRRLFGYLQDDATRTRPSIDLIINILRLVAPDLGYRRSLFDGTSVLQTAHLIEIGTDERNDLPASLRSVEIDQRIVRYLMGQDTIDNRLSEFVALVENRIRLDDLRCDPDQLGRLRKFAYWLKDRPQPDTDSGVTLFLHGLYGSGRLKAAQAICNHNNQPLLVVQAEYLLRAPQNYGLLIDLIYREARLSRAAVYWRNCEKLLQPDQPPQIWERVVSAAEAYMGVSFLASEAAWEPANHFQKKTFSRLDFPMPSYLIRKQIWLDQLPAVEDFAEPKPVRDTLAETLANSFQLTEGQIENVLVTAQGFANRRNPKERQFTIEDLYAGCRLQSSQRLVGMARRVEPRTGLTFEDLILPETNKKQLRELNARIRHRNTVYSGLGFEQRLSLGKGLIALFTGSSGTGKTMAAEVLARQQGVDLYKVDLSAVVSKWVGDTEKHLSQIFLEAEFANATLFFDEADALFGKRGDVKEAQDRWANLEVNYLLQRIEEYSGVIIMASNLGQNIDQAFMRRIHMIVEFPFPDSDARLRIWKGMFPKGILPPADNELQVIASRFKLAGGSIKNIVVDAAFRALTSLSDREPLTRISQRHLVVSTAREYQKQGKPITRDDFGDPFYSWVQEDIL